MKLISLLLIACSCSVLAAEKPTFETLTTEEGDVYHAVTVMTVKPDRIFIMHLDGGRNIKVEDLSADLQKELGIELNDEAKEYRVKVNEARKSRAKADLAALKRYKELQKKKAASGGAKNSSKSADDSFYFILQLTDEGVLAYKGVQKYTRIISSRSASIGGGGGASGGRPYIGKGDELFHIKLDNLEGLIDNQRIKLKTKESGTYQYISTQGSKKTLKQLTGTLLE